LKEKCLFCSEAIFLKLTFQPANVTHYFCAYHSGLMQALEELFKNPTITWSKLNE